MRRSGVKILPALMAMALISAVMLTATISAAQTIENPLEQTTSLTTGTLSLAAAGYQEIDMVSGLGQSATWVSSAIAAKSVVVRIRVLVNDSTTSTTRARFAWFAADPSSASLDGSTPAKSGVVIQEGDDIYAVMAGRYLALHGEAETCLIRIERVR